MVANILQGGFQEDYKRRQTLFLARGAEGLSAVQITFVPPRRLCTAIGFFIIFILRLQTNCSALFE